MVAKPVGIRTVLSSVPSWTGHDGGDPRRYFKLGRFTMGNTDGFQFSHGIEYGQQLLYPMPPVWELLAYDIKNGASCLFQELVDVPDLTLKQPWDRTPGWWAQSATPSVNGGTGNTTAWTYTVPTGRRLFIAHLSLQIVRMAVATTAVAVAVAANAAGNQIAQAAIFTNVIGATAAERLSAGPLLLAPGQTVNASYFSLDAGGQCAIYMFASGYLFDA